MGPIDLFWHLLDFFGPAVGVGMLTAGFAKLVWRRELKSVRWSRLAFWSTLACGIASVAGLVVFGHDGKMATYAAMLAACALSLWGVGFGTRRG